MSFFGFGAPTRNWKIGEFGEYQKIFNTYFQHPYLPKRRFFNQYFIWDLQVTRTEFENDAKFYRIMFQSYPKEPNSESARFIVDFENRGDPNNPLTKSTTFLSIETPTSQYSVQEHYDVLDYSSMCEKWLTDALFYKNYEIYSLSLISPPKFDIPTRATFHINRLEIETDEDEKDMLYAYYWLNFFQSRSGSIGPKIVKIRSLFIEMKIAGNQMLKEIEKIEIHGKFDITADWVRNYSGYCFIWRKMEEENKFTTTELKTLYEKVRLTENRVGIFLDQGNVIQNDRMHTWLNKNYGANMSFDIGYKCHGAGNDLVTFYSRTNRTVIEKSLESTNVGVMKVEDFLKE
ncbi:unnamed protein product [Caenorhabditis angaria]|uniref:Uncharacterized protein n=1 Tax=Caenorhabditis angaria TaxID=860376 RepID=A0A9P1ISI4_9PELO|nr:unnamed protein product [Caenorhabditis angaria]